MGYYLHDVPGRMRIQIPALRRNSELAQDVQDLLESLSGVKSTSVNPVTGSVIVRYDPKMVHSTTILTLLSRERYIDLAGIISSRQHIETGLSKAGRAASKALIGIALDLALQGSPLSILTAFI